MTDTHLTRLRQKMNLHLAAAMKQVLSQHLSESHSENQWDQIICDTQNQLDQILDRDLAWSELMHENALTKDDGTPNGNLIVQTLSDFTDTLTGADAQLAGHLLQHLTHTFKRLGLSPKEHNHAL